MQNTTHAVMSQRIEPNDSPDDFPTPPWATRALIEHVLGTDNRANQSCLEPACGAGHMAKVLHEYFGNVQASDAYDYGYAPVRDYLATPYEAKAVDWVITNPPFRLAEQFVLRSLDVSRHGVAMLVRTVFLESVGRYNRLFSQCPPSIFAQFVEEYQWSKGASIRRRRPPPATLGWCGIIEPQKKPRLFGFHRVGVYLKEKWTILVASRV